MTDKDMPDEIWIDLTDAPLSFSYEQVDGAQEKYHSDRRMKAVLDAALGEVVIEKICRRLHSQAYCNENVDSEWRDFEDDAREILSDIRAATAPKNVEEE